MIIGASVLVGVAGCVTAKVLWGRYPAFGFLVFALFCMVGRQWIAIGRSTSPHQRTLQTVAALLLTALVSVAICVAVWPNAWLQRPLVP